MKLTKKEKIEKSKELAERLKKASHIFFTEFQGLKFVDLDELRSKLRPLHCRYSVIKNTLVANALKQAGCDGFKPDLLKGPVGMVVAESGDAAPAAKVLIQANAQFPQLKVKAAYVEHRWLTNAECKALSALGSRTELLAKAAGALYGALSQSAAILQAPLRDFVLVLSAVEDKKKKESEKGAAVA